MGSDFFFNNYAIANQVSNDRNIAILDFFDSYPPLSPSLIREGDNKPSLIREGLDG